jgi:hypothetical protein
MKRGKGFKVTPDAKALLDANRFDEFKTAFGDSFVRGLQTGGEFYAVIRITSVSMGKQLELAATLQAEANGLLAGGSFIASFTQANSSQSTRSEFTAMMYQKAGSGAQISPTVQISEVIDRFKKFPEIASNSTAAYETEVATYDTLPLPLPTPEEREDFLLALADAREKKLRCDRPGPGRGHHGGGRHRGAPRHRRLHVGADSPGPRLTRQLGRQALAVCR